MTHFTQITLVGAGLIGASLAHNIRQRHLADRLVVVEANEIRCQEVLSLGLVDEATVDLNLGVLGPDFSVPAMGWAGMKCTSLGT